jgi:hypothetical protein
MTERRQPVAVEPRLLSQADAAAYCGMAATKFRQLVDDGVLPKPLFTGGRWQLYDRAAIDRILDAMSGIAAASEPDHKAAARQAMHEHFGR